MSKKTKVTPTITSNKFKVEFQSIPGWDIAVLPRLSELITEANIPAVERGKSSAPVFPDPFVIRVLEVGDFYYEKFFQWIISKPGDLAFATLSLLDANDKPVKIITLSGLEIIQLSGMPLSTQSFIGTEPTCDFTVTMKIGKMQYSNPT